jgi:hypothetical protein
LREYLHTTEKSEVTHSPAFFKRIEEELAIGIDALSHPRKLKAV